MSRRLARVHAHPLRDRVLFEYQGEPASPSEVARRLGRPVNVVSYHTRVLADHGCIELVRTERRRGATVHYYRSTIEQAIDDDEWLEVPAALRRALSLGTLRVIAEEARAAALDGAFDARGAHLTRSHLELDDEGVKALGGVLRTAFDALARIEAESRARTASSRRVYAVAILGFGIEAARG